VVDNAALQRAMAALQARNFTDAERLFKEVLRVQPKHVAALNLLGIVLLQTGRFAEAETFLRQALNEYPKSDATLYNYGIALKALNRPAEALDRFSQALALKPDAFETWNNRGTVFNDLGRYDEAIADFDKAIALNPRYAEAICNKGKSLDASQRSAEALAAFEKASALRPDLVEAWLGRAHGYGGLKRYDEALAAFEKALALRPDLAEAWLGGGNLSSELGRYPEALTAYEKALALKPDLAEARLGRGNVFAELKRHDDALAAYDDALALKPDLAEAWLGRGNIFAERKSYDDALACYDAALSFKPDLADAWFGRGNVFAGRNGFEDAFSAYDKALFLKPDFAKAWLGRGNVFYATKRLAEALAAYDQALALKPDLAEAWHGRGNVLTELNRYDEALATYERALALRPDFAEAWFGSGNVLTQLKRYGEAFTAYDKAATLKPESNLAVGARLFSKLRVCNWTNLDTEVAQLLQTIEQGKGTCAPFALFGVPASPAQELQCARSYVQDQPVFEPLWRGETYAHDRIRVAYVSPDLREHAVAYLMAGFFEHHDRSRFEVTAISWGPEQDTEFSRRIRNSFERFVDARGMSDQDIAALIREHEVDIVVDLHGFAGVGRLAAFARRPAPVQVNYLGYAGTMGADYYDYIIADSTVIPPEHFEFYGEKAVWLPDSFMASDNARRIAERTPSRRELGLPESGFVFCCFNQSFKINPESFETWMRLLHAVEGSVLWLKDNESTSTQTLRREAESRGIASERLIFAGSVPDVADHLARHRQADLFLDTLHYNAHTTASDSLWAGVPLLTCLGSTFASRVAASLVRAAGLPELVTGSLAEYEALALKIAREPPYLAALKAKLERNRTTSALFDTARFTRNMEAAYIAMWERSRRGEPPAHIAVEHEQG
jgi:predicted O-linked N-acetylglucosamine transferase (SPINDLY family)